MRLDRFRVFPILSGHEIRRDFWDLVSAARPAAVDGARLRGAFPLPCLDLIWTSDPAPEAEPFLDALRPSGGAALVSRSAVEEVAAELPSDDPGGRNLRRLLCGEVLDTGEILLFGFDDRRVPCLGWISRRNEVLVLHERIRRLADQATPVLITGETGTGKDVVARGLHRLGRRAARPWLAINCAELPEGLLESELFGHVRGAFTGAISERVGLLESAGTGTAFLDEIGELRPPVQSKLLRVLEEHRVRPLGSSRSRPLRCRLVAATNRDLEVEIQRGGFRADLFFRLRGAEIDLVPLRDRSDDVIALASSYLFRASLRVGRRLLGLSEEAVFALTSHSWPGNVRELRQSIEAAALATNDEWLRLRDLRLLPGRFPGGEKLPLVPVRTLERMQILRALRETSGNKVAAARLLGLTRQSLQRRIERHDIRVTPDFGHRSPKPVTALPEPTTQTSRKSL